MSTYRSRIEIPPLVQQAHGICEQLAFTRSCLPAVGRFLGVLAAHVQDGIIGEIGTGCGVATAWMASFVTANTQLVSVENDAMRAQAVAALFRHRPNVRILHADWPEILAYGPFDLLFFDGGPLKAPLGGTIEREKIERVITATRFGGCIVLDDLTPDATTREGQRPPCDPVREFWLNDPRFAATEVLTTPDSIAILATRLG